MTFPTATYRIQFNKDFTFRDLRQHLPYLHRLGVSTVYASPIFKARAGSTHGYDVADPHQLNPEIGTLEEFRELREEMREMGMGWLQDIVPNHTAYDYENRWLQDVFERGPASPHYRSFDIDWNHPDEKWRGKVMAPFLGEPPEEVLEKGELKIALEEDGVVLSYYENRFAMSARSYAFIIDNYIKKESDFSSEKKEKLQNWLSEFSDDKDENWPQKKEEFSQFFNDKRDNDTFQEFLENLNGDRAKMREILDQQYFKLVHWQTTERHINYRRFFTINGLICLRMEDDKVFEDYHSFIKELCNEKLITGLRIDHIDGLFDPRGYLEKLRNLVGEDFYIVVEKILEQGEYLPPDWPVQGSSGYDFLAAANQVFVPPSAETAFTEGYQSFTAHLDDYEDLLFEKKQWILRQRMGGELENLYQLMAEKKLLPSDTITTKQLWKEALVVFLSGFPVYRIYPEKFPLGEEEARMLEKIREHAQAKMPTLKDELDYLRRLFLGEAEAEEKDQLYFLQRCQQFTGPLAAKGVEDTAYYLYNRLISRNEVGDDPSVFGSSAAGFYQKMLHRAEHLPQALNATATHDTKRGEDARMRINALAERPQEWFKKVDEWAKSNQSCKTKKAPSENEEYLIYQSLVGAWLGEKTDDDFKERSREFLQKALREAKAHTSWSAPDEKYEGRVFHFLDSILENEKFLKTFRPFAEKISRRGALLSLGQVALKLAAAGIPDIYQGTEFWDFSYVDPDNRRPVDFEERKQTLGELENVDFAELAQDWENPKLKMHLLHRGLLLRRELPVLFEKGEYLPLKIQGKAVGKMLAFARHFDKKWILVIVPLRAYFFSNENTWKDTQLLMPKNAPQKWRDILSKKMYPSNEHFSLQKIAQPLPLFILKNNEDEI